MADNPDVNPPNLLIKRLENNPPQGPQETYTLYADDDTFPQSNKNLIVPEQVTTLRRKQYLNSIRGWQFFYGGYDDFSNTKYAVCWNLITNACFQINVTANEGYESSVVGFGVDPVTDQIQLVKISFTPNAFRGIAVDVFTWVHPVNLFLGGLWGEVLRDSPFMLSYVECAKVSVGGVVYFRGFDEGILNVDGFYRRNNHLFRFNLRDHEFGVKNLTASLKYTDRVIQLANVNESLRFLVNVNQDLGNVPFCEVLWFDNVNEWHRTLVYGDVLGFRHTGHTLVELRGDGVANIGLYFDGINGNPWHIIDVGINGGIPNSFVVRPYFGNVAYD